MPYRTWMPREWVSRLIAGAAAGCGLLLAADLFVLVPIWGPPLSKVDPRWETVFFVAAYALPAAIAVGAVAGLAWPWSREVRLSRGALVGCSFAVAFVSRLFRPFVARIHRGVLGPLYEVVPDALTVAFILVALVVAVWPFGEPPSNPDAEPDAAADGGA